MSTSDLICEALDLLDTLTDTKEISEVILRLDYLIAGGTPGAQVSALDTTKFASGVQQRNIRRRDNN